MIFKGKLTHIFSKNLFTSFKDFQNNDKKMRKLNHLKMNVTNHCIEKSQICNYKKLIMAEVLKDFVAADRKGDWEAHLLAIQNFLLIFRGFDTTSYLQCESLHLENMHLLPQEIHTNLCKAIWWLKKDTSHIMLSQEISN